jgi:hypothetical protein
MPEEEQEGWTGSDAKSRMMLNAKQSMIPAI